MQFVPWLCTTCKKVVFAWVSVMVTFLVDLFEIETRSQLNNLCTSGKAISGLVEVFGIGSLALLHAMSTQK